VSADRQRVAVAQLRAALNREGQGDI
jgi:hypothetical protein